MEVRVEDLGQQADIGAAEAVSELTALTLDPTCSVDDVVAAVTRHLDNAAAVAAALAWLVRETEFIDKHEPYMVCVPVVLTCLDRHGSDADVAVQAVTVLNKLARTEANRLPLLAHVDAVLPCLQYHNNSEVVTEAVLELLSNLALCNENKEALLPCAVPVVECVRGAVGDIAPVAKFAVQFLYLLSTAQNNQMRMLSCVPVLVDYARRHPGDPSIVLPALVGLINVSLVAEHKAYIASLAAETVLVCLRRNEDSEAIVTMGLKLVTSITVSHPIDVLCEPESLDTLAACGARHLNSAVVAQDLLSCFFYLAESKECSKHLMAQVPVALHCIKTYPGNAFVVQAALGVLAKLSVLPESKARLLDEVDARTVVDCVQRHTVAAEAGLRYLSNVCSGTDEAVKSALATHAQAVLVWIRAHDRVVGQSRAVQAGMDFLLNVLPIGSAADGNEVMRDALQFATTVASSPVTTRECRLTANWFIFRGCFGASPGSQLKLRKVKLADSTLQDEMLIHIRWTNLSPTVEHAAVTWVRQRQLQVQGGELSAPPSPSPLPEWIGSGGFGSAWQVEKNGVQLAVKAFRIDVMGFEASALRRVVGHVNIVAMMGYCLEPAGVVMELVALDGRSCSLHHWLSSPSNTRDLRQQLAILRQVCDGVAFVHSRNLVHCDLKPSNILMTRFADGSLCAKISDFGMAIDVSDGPAKLVGGTQAYACPCDCFTATDKGFDVWSFGLIMAEMLLGTQLRLDAATLSRWRHDDTVQGRLSADVMRLSSSVPGSHGKAAMRLVVSCLQCNSAGRPTFESLSSDIERLWSSCAEGTRADFVCNSDTEGSLIWPIAAPVMDRSNHSVLVCEADGALLVNVDTLPRDGRLSSNGDVHNGMALGVGVPAAGEQQAGVPVAAATVADSDPVSPPSVLSVVVSEFGSDLFRK